MKGLTADCSHECPSNHAPRLRTLISESSTVTNSSCTLLNWEPTKGNSVFVSFILSQARTSAIQQSQSKLLGRFAVFFLPSQCWCARCGELTAINNIGRTRRLARSRNSAVGCKAPNYFCLRLKLGLLWGVHHVKEMSTRAWRTNTAEYMDTR